MGPEVMPEKKDAGTLGVAWSVARGVLSWALVGCGTAAVISFLVLSAYAVFVFEDAGPAAAVLGAIQSVWLYLERTRWRSSRELFGFGSLSGAALGLLGFAPSFAQTTVNFSWSAISVLLCAALAGGLAAGSVNAWFFVSQVRADAPPGYSRWLFTGCCLVLSVAAFEYWHYGPIIIRKLPVPKLSESSVLNLPAGDATGSRWSGLYRFRGETFESSGMVGGERGLIQFVQNNGSLKVCRDGDEVLAGGINANGEFWAGSQRTGDAALVWRGSQGAYALRWLLKGKFLDNDHFEYSSRTSLLENGRFRNSTRVDGTGDRLRAESGSSLPGCSSGLPYKAADEFRAEPHEQPSGI